MMKRTRSSLLIAFILGLCALNATAAEAQRLRDRVRHRFEQLHSAQSPQQQETIAGLHVAIWRPANCPTAGAPLVVFSHGFHGSNTQSKFLMKALADAGYLVVAPNHKDALGAGHGFSKPEMAFAKADEWTDQTYKNRADDLKNLLSGLHSDQKWSKTIDWTKVALAGHSLGGYTVLGLAGAWPKWKVPEVKAVLALSPYCQPFIQQHSLKNLTVPIMYQSGTRDFGIAPFISRPNGAFDETPSPVIYVLFDQANHFAFSDLNRDSHQMDSIKEYSLAFLNKYLLHDASANPEVSLPGAKLRIK